MICSGSVQDSRIMRAIFCFVFVLFVNWCHADCGVVTKEEWGGLSHPLVEHLSHPISLVIIAHTVTPFCNTPEECKEIIRMVDDYMWNYLNIPDTGYSFLVGGDGNIYEGAGWLRVGAHTRGYNRKSIGIGFLGNYNNDAPTPAQVEAVQALLKCGVELGHLTPDHHLVGHKQVVATESPGRKLYEEIRRWPQWVEKVEV